MERMTVEQALADLETLAKACNENHMTLIAQAMREPLDTLRAELDGMRADAERLDWLEATKADVFETQSSEEFAVQHYEGGMLAGAGYAPTLRAAIDAARQEKGHE